MLLTVGAVAGPLLLALATAAISRTEYNPAAPAASGFKYNKGQAAEMLFRAYAPHRPPPWELESFDIRPPSYWADCGYPVELDGIRARLSPRMRAIQEMGERAQTRLAAAFRLLGFAEQDKRSIAKLDRTTSTFGAVFLRRCIESTLARPLCVANVTERLDGDHWGPDFGGVFGEYELRCQAFDGIAAHNGLALPKR